jgi:hypothetical protein
MSPRIEDRQSPDLHGATLSAASDPRHSVPMTPSTPRPDWSGLALVAAWLALLAFGFVARPHGCAWGTDAYGYAALGVIGFGVALPWLRRDIPWMRRLQLTVAFGFASLVIAVAGFWLADLPLLCP